MNSLSEAQWKIILNSVPITDMKDLLGPAIADDRWQGYPEDRSDILTFIEEEQIPNIQPLDMMECLLM